MSEQDREKIDQLNQQVDILYRNGQYAEATRVGIQTLDLAQHLLAEEDLIYATCLNNLGTVYDALGNHEQAAELYTKALAMRRKILGEAHPAVAQSLHNLAALSEALGDYTRAEELYQQALATRRTTLAQAHPETATTLNNLAELDRLQGKYPQAEAYHTEALQMRQLALPEGHPEIATSLNNLALLYSATGKYARAESLYQQALTIWQTSLGYLHPHTGTCLNNLAALYELVGEYAQAEQFYQQALEIRKIALGEQHPDVADTLNNLAGLYRLTGRYHKAEPLYQQVLALRHHLFGEIHPQVAEILNNLGVMYQAMGNMHQALTYYERAMSIWRAVLGDEHPHVGTCFNNIGVLYMDIGNYTLAERFYLRALAIRLASLGYTHVDSADTLSNLAELYFYRQDYEQAASFYRRALEIRHRVLGEVHTDIAAGLNNLALVYEAMGDYEQAENFYLQAGTIWNKVLGGRHPDSATNRYNLALFYLARGRLTEAWTLIKEATGIDDLFIGQIFSISSESQRMAYLSTLQNHYNMLLSFVYEYQSIISSLLPWGFDLIQRRKTIRAEALAVQRDALLGGRYPALVPKLQELNRLRSQIAQKTLEGPASEDLKAHQQSLETLSMQRDHLEAELTRQIPEMDLMSQLQQVDRQALCQILPPGAALIEFVQFYQFDFQTFSSSRALQDQPAHYVAFVLISGEPDTVQFIDIGRADVIDQMIATFRTSFIGAGRHLSIGSPGEETGTGNGPILRSTVFDPLLPALHERKQLFVAPDGDLYNLPFEILPTDDENYLTDTYQMSYLDSGRDLLRLKAWSPSQPGDSLVMAAPDFDLSCIEQTSSEPLIQVEEQVRQARGERDFSFEPLPGAEQEGKQVATYLGVKPYLGRDAVESRLKSWRSPDVLHLATHGFFLKKTTERKKSKPSTSISRLEWLLTYRVENPLLRSGLALAGANTWSRRGTLPPEAEDGILTAEDVSSLDLLATRLVVLSACETGLGEVQIGEGIFGLRRAFTLAGARTLVVSLWKVPDTQTQELMERFYRSIVAGLPCGEALYRARQEMKTIHKNPFYWGAFICQGDPYTTLLPNAWHSADSGT